VGLAPWASRVFQAASGQVLFVGRTDDALYVTSATSRLVSCTELSCVAPASVRLFEAAWIRELGRGAESFYRSSDLAGLRSARWIDGAAQPVL
jgi:hypothetical protein